MRYSLLAFALPLAVAGPQGMFQLATFYALPTSTYFFPGYPQNVAFTITSNLSKATSIVIESSLLPEHVGWSSVGQPCQGTEPGASIIHCEMSIDTFRGFPTLSFEIEESLKEPLMITFYAKAYSQEAGSSNTTIVYSAESTIKWKSDSQLVKESSYFTQRNSSIYPQPRTIKVPALPNAVDERQRLKQALLWADFHPTGFYLNPYVPLPVNVSGVSNYGPRPEILVGTPSLIYNHKEDLDRVNHSLVRHELNNGKNVIIDSNGGIMYIRYVFAADQEKPPPITITLEGGAAAQPIPFFREGITTNQEWIHMMINSHVPYVEHAGKHVIITGHLFDAYPVAYNNGQDQQVLLNTYKDIIAAQDAISGLNATASDSLDRPSPLRPMVVQGSRKRYADSADYRAAIGAQQVNTQHIWSSFTLEQSWKVWHELGHQRQHTMTWSWSNVTEVTVNIYSLAASRFFREGKPGLEHGRIAEWESAREYLGGQDKDFDGADHFVQLVMFEQLRVLFGDEFYHMLHQRSRRARALDTDADKKHYFMKEAAMIAKMDLASFFTTWGLKPEERTIDAMKSQPKPKKDYTATPVFGGH
ncbi:hypothetical protein CDD81_5620 [Ophiocordyceps australis]|uniref:Peptidase M60 domain-containing protein n=1 Tax=Ophiocordyceps australis TaxID=1399860 RepID=A0A2C5X9X9_9HYPO|nr:hypothetical protein CDD81_5620 [Ophiocordyceps australis]